MLCDSYPDAWWSSSIVELVKILTPCPLRSPPPHSLCGCGNTQPTQAWKFGKHCLVMVAHSLDLLHTIICAGERQSCWQIFFAEKSFGPLKKCACTAFFHPNQFSSHKFFIQYCAGPQKFECTKKPQMEAGYSHLFSGLGWNKYNQQTDKTDRPKDRQTVGGGMHVCMERWGWIRMPMQNIHHFFWVAKNTILISAWLSVT